VRWRPEGATAIWTTISRSNIGPIIERPKAGSVGQISGPAVQVRGEA
jgi:hypothetical protein